MSINGPAHVTVSQTDPLDWFASPAGCGLLAAERKAMDRVLAGVPALPWAWIGPGPAAGPDLARPRGVLLHRHGDGFAGALRCRLPWPLASETFGAVLLQHVFDDGLDPAPLFGECARVLAPGGTLWLSTLNPWSPYRGRWWRSGLRARGPGAWQARLRHAGFAAATVHVQWLGPRWRIDRTGAGVAAADLSRAAMAITVGKRVHAAIPPSPLHKLRLQTG
ncbi:methyltransferase domain-containing protein [Lysobacter sp. D1-1-M9]|uniref:methyltransferase domain-containing protein n=1 Tax=Novilysobacter longmucuonensis TaxID=3098603 RepID=UPI002FCB2E29